MNKKINELIKKIKMDNLYIDYQEVSEDYLFEISKSIEKEYNKLLENYLFDSIYYTFDIYSNYDEIVLEEELIINQIKFENDNYLTLFKVNTIEKLEKGIMDSLELLKEILEKLDRLDVELTELNGSEVEYTVEEYETDEQILIVSDKIEIIKP